jgi:bromodomain adjacent to zinc finger domain protein 1A
MNFYQQPLYQCEGTSCFILFRQIPQWARNADTAVSGKSSLSYFAAYANERKEIRQLHTRFPKQLKKAVLTAVQFRMTPCSVTILNDQC